MNGVGRMICQLAKVPLGEQCLSSWRRGLGTPRLSTPTPQCPLLGSRFPRVGAGLGGSRNTILHQQLGTVNWISPVPECIRVTQYHIVSELPLIPECSRIVQNHTILYHNYSVPSILCAFFLYHITVMGKICTELDFTCW